MHVPGGRNDDHAAAFARAIVDERFAVRGGELVVEDVAIGELVRAYGTPLFVYSARSIDMACQRVRSCLPTSMRFLYSVKANPTLAIVRRLLANCGGLEVASAGELALALAAGCEPGRIVFAGPGKTDAELRLAVDTGIAELHVESIGEVDRLGRIAEERARSVAICIRVNPAASAQGGSMRMGGRPTAFGVDETQLPDAVAAIGRQRRLDLAGLHVYAGTQILDADVLLSQCRHALDLARRLTDISGVSLRVLNFGGGWGVPMFPGDRSLELDRVRAGLRMLVEEMLGDPALAGMQPVIEPGRHLVAESGIYVARVVDVKTSYGVTFAVLDGGMHHHLAASGNLGQAIKRNLPLAVLNRVDAPIAGTYEIVGPLCTPLDTLGRRVSLPHIAPGDLIGVLQSGAYARSASPLGFLSHPAPPEVLVEGATHRLVRRRGAAADLERDQIF